MTHDPRPSQYSFLSELLQGITASSIKYQVMLRNIFVICEKLYAPEWKFRAANGGLSLCTYLIYM